MKVLVTGGAGFIGSAVVRHLIAATDWHVVNVDKLTYAANPENVGAAMESPRYVLEQADICDAAAMAGLFARYRPDAVMHLAAESHVDRTIDGPRPAIETNLVGTFTLLEAAREYWGTLDAAAKSRFRFHHVSTDEVFGSLGPDGAFTEESPYRPNSPYSATKAGADHLVRAWHQTYGLPVVLSNCSNNYGPYQFPEKLIPLLISKARGGEPLPIYGRGENVRDWLYVEDHARGLVLVLERGAVGESYNFGGGAEQTNIEVAQALCALMDVINPGSAHCPHAGLIRFVADRPGHDLRYAIDWSKARDELGWQPQETFDSGLHKTLAWYLANEDWCAVARSDGYGGERLGLGRVAGA